MEFGVFNLINCKAEKNDRHSVGVLVSMSGMMSQRSHLTESETWRVSSCFAQHHSFDKLCGRGSRGVKVSDRGRPCHEFELSTTKDPPCRAAMHVKYDKS
ncbi:hypothetical protein TNCV_1501001 [Trichonephila clavipes]|uniref:Uncharacterized protein n=1 Tax=Trichonephila clavipes TaxID=2585209 RepID=A0A8X6V882_TRICX|nr:hypothetical protein TNCV_1501001 [Trichonephila clavipes]